jgi:4-methylaminobutanoate oxidase (formaldehyde-forming)
MLWGGELVLHDGAPAGQVTSAAWSATAGSAVGLAYVWRADRRPFGAADAADGRWDVMVGDTVTPVALSLRALYDPTSSRVRG